MTTPWGETDAAPFLKKCIGVCGLFLTIEMLHCSIVTCDSLVQVEIDREFLILMNCFSPKLYNL